ncbi:MAG TPA: thiamine pyrophosphate-dependent enzyme [Bryobacteraceae bacterium]|nr:thiamine pyrophosphate-dependent enzyme [Bryobacteraceae bacterium]
MATHVEVMAQALAERGVEYVFGLPGGEILAFVDACRRAGMRFLLTGHEASAAWMAQVVGQITGVPGVCCSTLGPGATNLVTAVANAYLDRAPLLAVTAQTASRAVATMTHQRLPLREMFSPLVKASVEIGEWNTWEIMQDALELAEVPRPGPVHIGIPSDRAREMASATSTARSVSGRGGTGLQPVLIDRILAAERPLVIVGLGAIPSAAPAVRGLIDKLQAPFLVTPKVKGIVPEDHPLFLGVASGMCIDGDILETIRTADLLVGIGFDPVECDKTWFADVDVVAIDAVSMAEGDYQPREAIGNVPSLVDRLAASLPGPKSWPPELLASRRAAIRREPAEGLSPLRLIEELRAVFPRDGIATCDVGSHKLAIGQFWRSYEPGTFFMSNGLSGMGFGIPAAIGAQLVLRDKPVIAMVGDGGMLMMLHDLVLIRELGLPILIVVFSDRSLSLIRVSSERKGFPPYGVDFCPPDFAAVAAAFGIAGRRVASIEEVRACAEQALSSKMPFVMDVPLDYREYYDLV